ncbi:MAG: 5-formyltetrahydrofolate cyclo-ligase [Phycisphaerales bacterium]|nr:MAG: 5-formyltetrahydrofolate cyclo-ligase [Phycisphaerales bacterium]
MTEAPRLDLKEPLRETMRERLRALTEEDILRSSNAVARRVVASAFFESASTVMLYLPIPGEVDILGVALRAFQQGKTVCVPRMDWRKRRMTAVEIRTVNDGFEQRQHGVREPASGRPVPIEEIDLVLAPGLAFDAAGRRLGRGGGFYDRFLSQPRDRRSMRTTCGVCFDIQIVDRTPTDEHDQTVDVVATDRRLICAPCRNRA